MRRDCTTAPVGGGYRPGLDGIRALAVVAVLGFHLDRLSGGNLGVDAFFVLSGWLITWRLLNEADRSGTVDLGSFWSARVRRIMPASMAVLVTVALVWPLAGIDVPSLRRDVVWAAGWASNWGTITSGGDYWARFGDLSPVTHFWSLAIEEQFYLAWPLVLLVVVGRSRNPRLVVGVLSATAALASIIAMNMMFDPNDPTATYMNTFGRAHNLLIGATVAAFTTVLADGRLRGGRIARRCAPAGTAVAVVIIALSSDQSTWMFRWGFPVFAVAMVIVVVAAADGYGEWVLAWTPLRWLGDRSYGLYLWHWPVFLFLSSDRLGASESGTALAMLDLVRVAIAVLLADLSFRFLEQPIRRGRLLRRRRGLAAAPVSFAVVVILALVTVPSPARPSDASVVTLAPPATTTAPTSTSDDTNLRPPSSQPGSGESPSNEPASSAPGAGTSQPTSPAPAEDLAPLRVIVTGDSTGVHLAEALIAYADTVPDQLVVGSAAAGGCGLSAADDGRLHEFTNPAGERELIDLTACHTQWESVPERVVDEAIDVVLVEVGPWDAVDIHLANGDVVSVVDTVGHALVADAYNRFSEQVRTTGATLVWVTPADTHLGWGRVDDPLNEPARWNALRAIVDGLDVMQIDLPGWLVAEGLTGPEARPDGVHLTAALNDRFVAEQVAPALNELRIGAAARTVGTRPLTSIAVLGDSMSAGLAAPLRAALANDQCSLVWKWCIGFLIPSSAATWEEVLTEEEPDVVVLFFAPWENEALRQGDVIDPTDPEWPAIYRREHVEPWVTLARSSRSEVIWVSMPLSRDAELSAQHQDLNAIWADVVAGEPSMFWVDGRTILAAPDGSFTEIDASVDPAVRLVNLDGLHICPAGAERIADAVLEVLAGRFQFDVQDDWRHSGWEDFPEAFGPGCPSPN